MLRQLQLRVPIKAVQLKRSLTYTPKQWQSRALIDVLKKQQQSKQMQHKVEQLMVIKPVTLMGGCSNVPRLELPIKRQYSVCPKPYELQLLPRGSSNQNGGNNNTCDQQSSNNVVALVPLEQSQSDHKKPQSKMPEQQQQHQQPSTRKIPYYNPLRRRSNVDPARVQYIKDRFKERNIESDASKKTSAKKFVSRTTLHSGRLDKID
ncbi:uncharacterized protein LOC117578137 [Drosophila albomicans]|uniref:Uncharacterized protein LOC117578137 n=1 Tax=Drosophila albomicans TaxID=7291 RepID=A0A6P8ZG40_DROAB|nr:uncharacterized protein LOC117578137 [Drosophila albomicans]